MVLLLKASHEDKDQLLRKTAGQPARQTDRQTDRQINYRNG